MLVRNLSTVTLNLRKGGQKFVLLPGKATTIPEFLFSKEEVKAIYGHHIQVLNDKLEVLDAVTVAKKPTINPNVEIPVEVAEDAAVDEVVEDVVEEAEAPVDVVEEQPADEAVEEVPAVVEEAVVEDAAEAVLDEVLEAVEVAEEPKKAKRGGRKPNKKAE